MSSLGLPVLVLNKVWIPIRVITVKRSLKLLFADKVSVVFPDDYSVYNWGKWVLIKTREEENGILATIGKIKIPEVILLLKYDKVYYKRPKLTKRNIYIRDKYHCQYSGKQVSLKESDIDHVIPRSKGGKNSWDNMVVCSKEINRIKGNRTPKEAGLQLLKVPEKPIYKNLMIDPRLKIPESWGKFVKIDK